MNKFSTKGILCALALILTSQCYAEYAVIVHPSNKASLDKKDIARLFLGKVSKFSTGGSATPVNMSEGSPTRVSFDKEVVGKSESQMKAYWTEQVFSGRGTAPQEFAQENEVVLFVSGNPDGIGYVDVSAVNNSVKVVYTFE